MALSPSQKNNSNSDSLLVTEQSGLATSLVGIFFAVALGLVVRGALAPEKIRSRVEEAAQRLGEGIRVNIDQASFSLARGVVPDFSVVLKNVHIDVNKKCLLSPDAEINEIRFPISLGDLLAGRPFFHEVQVDTMILLLRNEMKDCPLDEKKDSASVVSGIVGGTSGADNFSALAGHATGQTAGQTILKQEKNTKSQAPSDIQFVSINRLKVNYLPLPFTSFELLDLDLHVRSESPKIYNLKSNLDLGGETLSGDYSSHARIDLTYDETQHPQIASRIHGSWREGQYDFTLSEESVSHELQLAGELRHIPLSQVFPVLKKYKVMVSDFNGRQTWLSGQFEAKGKLNNMSATPLRIKDLKVEGDLGEISLENAEIKKWTPVVFDPVVFNLKDIDLKNLLLFLNRPHPSPALGSLGLFNGRAELNSNQSVRLSGQQQGLEMIFSNRGQREVQVFSEVAGDLVFDQGRWTGDISKINIKDGEFKGKASLSSDKDWKDLYLNFDIEKLTLAPKVQKLVTGHGVAEKLQAKIKSHLVQGELKQLDGSLRGEQVEIEGLKMTKPQFLFSTRGEDFQVDFSAAALHLESAQVFTKLISQFKANFSELQIPSDYKKVSSQFKTKSLQNFEWNSFDMVADQFRLQSSGGWNHKSEVFGQIQTVEKGKVKKWKLSGTRDQPQLSH